MPMHSLVAVALVLAFSFNLPLALLAVWFNNPLTLPFMYLYAYRTGCLVLNETPAPSISPGPCTGWAGGGYPGAPFLLGSLLLAVLSAAAGALLTLLLLQLGKLTRPARLPARRPCLGRRALPSSASATTLLVTRCFRPHSKQGPTMAEPLTLAHANGNPSPCSPPWPIATASSPGPPAPARQSPCRCWRRVFPPRRAGLSCRREGGSERPGRRRHPLCQAGCPSGPARPSGTRLCRQPHPVLGSLRRRGPPGAGHRLRHGASVACTPARPQRHPERGAGAGVQGGGRRGVAAARSERPAGHGAVCGGHAKTLTTRYGNVSTASIGAILRNLLTLEARAAITSSASPCWTSRI